MGKRKGPRITVSFSFRGSVRLRVPPHWIVLAIALALYLLAHGSVPLPAHMLEHVYASTTG